MLAIVYAHTAANYICILWGRIWLRYATDKEPVEVFVGAYYGQKVSAATRAIVVQMSIRRADLFQDEYPPITACVCVHISVQKRRGIRPENAATYAVWGVEQLILCDTD